MDKFNPIFEPVPDYMRALVLSGARFVEGNTGEGGAAGDGGDDGAQEPTGGEPGDKSTEGGEPGDKSTEGGEPGDDDAADGDDGDETAQLSEQVEELTGKVSTLETDLQAARDENAKIRILVERGLDLKFVPMLNGGNAEAWGAAADALVELRGNNAPYTDPAQESARNGGDRESARETQAADFFAGLDNH